MGIDYGDSRIGIAVSDPFGWIALGLDTISNQGSLSKVIEKILTLAQENKVEKIIIGYPKNMNGTIGPRGEKTLEFINLLDKAINFGAECPVELIKWDERLTTVAANRAMHEMGTKISKKKALVDKIAATYILQGYLDSIKK
jgi:putative Holliday junction resolvase